MAFIFEQCSDPRKLRTAIRKTFEVRGTEIPKSFAATAKEYKLNILKGAWASVEQMGGYSISFETAWQAFLRVLSVLDSGG